MKAKGSRGVTLVETLVGLAILGLVAVIFLGGVTTFSRATVISDERVAAESLARSQMENLRDQSYIDFAPPNHRDYRLDSVPAPFSAQLVVTPLDPNTLVALPSGQDLGLQKMAVSIRRGTKAIITVENYKVNR